MPEVGGRVGHYQIIRVLGRGGMGEVYEGWDETLRRRVALKAIRADHRLNEATRNRFLREARVLSQLDDPSICRIFDYVRGEDADLLVLELIEGRTLRAAIREGLDFRARLDVAEAVAGALVAAHRAGVVHRDLKSENVMLTSSGGVKVLDFGLARACPVDERDRNTEGTEAPRHGGDLEDADATMDRRVPARRTDDASSDTRLGETVGTPMYMSPEQARGETITPASDVYSFGLVLQELFTGKLPYPDGMPAREVMLAASRGESLPPAGIDRDVAALIQSLKRLAPTDRPTALDAATRIRWIRDRRKRLARRMLAAAALLLVVLAAIKYVVDVNSERDAAIAARADAELRRGQADALIAFMIGDLRRKLEPVGKLDVLDGVGDQALRYFASLRPDEIQARDLRRNAQTLNQLGEVRMAQGNLDGAEKVLLRSLDLASVATVRDPTDARAWLELGASQFWMGSLLRQKGDLDGALRYYTMYLGTSEALFSRDRNNLEYLLEVGYGHSNVGTVLEEQGKLEAALEHYRTTVALKERRLSTDPARADWKADLATTVNKVAAVLESLGRFREAQAEFLREHELLTEALADHPDDRRWLLRLAVNHSFLGDTAEELGSNDRALDHFRKQHAIETQLVAHDPENGSWQRNLASTDAKIGRILRYRGELKKAEEHQRAALSRLEPKTKGEGVPVGWRRDIASWRAALAVTRLEQGDAAEARRHLDIASMTVNAIQDDEPDTQRVRWRVGLCRGLAASRTGDGATARLEWSAVADALWPSHAELRDVRDLDTLARALLYLGRIGDAAPIVSRLDATGYRSHDLVVLWTSRSTPNHRNRAPAQKGP